MKSLFADTSFWLALFIPRDMLHSQAVKLMQSLTRGARIVTSELVIVEVLDHFAHMHPIAKDRVATWASEVQLSFGYQVVVQNAALFEDALQLYRARADKSWSFVDCTSFTIMRQLGILEALSADHHFEQAGFTALLK